MKTKQLLLLIITLIFLSGCSKEVTATYTDTGRLFDGKSIFIYDSKQEICAEWYSMSTVLDDNTTYSIRNTCPKTTMLKMNDGTYKSFFTYVKEHDVDMEELKATGIGYFSYDTTLNTELDISLDEFELIDIILKELNNDIIESGEWTTKETINLSLDDIKPDLRDLFNSPIKSNEVCRETLCRMLYSQGPILITLQDDTTTLIVELYENQVNIKVFEHDQFSQTLYNYNDNVLPIRALYETIITEYNTMNNN